MIVRLFLIGLLALPAHAEQPHAYRFSRSLQGIPADGSTLSAVTLDDAVYAEVAADFGDLRLLDTQGVETPYLLQKIAERKTEIRRLPSPLQTANLQKIGSDGIAVFVELKQDAAQADGLTVVTAQRDFEYDLQVFGSADGKSWQPLVEHAAIYDYSRYMAVGNRDVALPANSYRRFKIVAARASQTRSAEVRALSRTWRGDRELQRHETAELQTEPLHVERIELWHNVTESVADAEQRFDYPLTGLRVTEDAERQTTLIDLDSGRQPLTGLTLNVATPSFSRRAQVQIPVQTGIESRWQTLSDGMLEALRFQDLQRNVSLLSFAEQRQAHYRIVVHNQDNPPLTVTGATGHGPGYRLLFLPQPGLGYALHYGADRAEPPRYDTAPLRELLSRGYSLATATLGPVSELTPTESSPDWQRLLNSKGFLIAAIALMVAALGWSLYRIGKRLGDLPK